jgi:ASCH domain
MPMIISFAKTTGALLDGKKTVTRRDWPDSHAAKFKPGAVVIAYDKQPMYGGEPVARIKIVSIRRESLNELLADERYAAAELAREGGLWRDLEAFLALFSKCRYGDPYRVEFRILERLASAASVRCPDHRRGGATRCPRGGAALQLWQRDQWEAIARESARMRRGRR